MKKNTNLMGKVFKGVSSVTDMSLVIVMISTGLLFGESVTMAVVKALVLNPFFNWVCGRLGETFMFQKDDTSKASVKMRGLLMLEFAICVGLAKLGFDYWGESIQQCTDVVLFAIPGFFTDARKELLPALTDAARWKVFSLYMSVLFFFSVYATIEKKAETEIVCFVDKTKDDNFQFRLDEEKKKKTE